MPLELLLNVPLVEMKLFSALTSLALAAQAAAISISGRQIIIDRDNVGLQDIVSGIVSLEFLRLVLRIQ